MQSNRPWIVVGSANDSGNLGDEAMWETAVSAISNELGAVDIFTDGRRERRHERFENVSVKYPLFVSLLRFESEVTSNSKWIRFCSKVANLFFKKAFAKKKFDQAILEPTGVIQLGWSTLLAKAEGVVFSGAGAAASRYVVSGVLAGALICAWAEKANVPVYFLGQGLGPLEKEYISIFSRFASKARYFGVRDVTSAENAEKWGINNATLEPDWALRLMPSQNERNSAHALWRHLGSPAIALCLHSYPRAMNREKLKLFMCELALFALDNGQLILLVPNMYGEGISDDAEFMDMLLRNVPLKLRKVFVRPGLRLNVGQTRSILSLVRVAVTTRYHSMVFANGEGVRTVGIALDDYWHQKLIGAQRAAGQEIQVATLKQVEKFVGMLNKAWQDSAFRKLGYPPVPALPIDFFRKRLD